MGGVSVLAAISFPGSAAASDRLTPSGKRATAVFAQGRRVGARSRAEKMSDDAKFILGFG
jgi:hypothetical protein